MTPDAPLRRDLGLTDAVAVGLGSVVGAGLFAVLGVGAGLAGPALVVALLLAGLAATCNGLSAAELAARFPQSGGTYESAYRLLGPWAGFSAGWLFVVSKSAAGATAALGLGSALAAAVPWLDARATAVGACALLTGANLLGVRRAGLLNRLIVGTVLVTLAAFLAAGVGAWDAANWEPFAPRGLAGIAEAAAVMFFAYTGYARVATLGEEVRDPVRTIPRAILWTLGLSITLYVAVAAVAIGAVGAGALAGDSAPLWRAAPPGARPLVTLGAVAAMAGVLLGQILGVSRVWLAMARRGDAAAALARVGRRSGVPSRGVLLTGALTAGGAALGGIQATASLSAFAILVYYALTNLAALRLTGAEKRFPRAVSWLGLGLCLALAAALPWDAVAGGVGLLAAGWALRAARRRDRRGPPAA